MNDEQHADEFTGDPVSSRSAKLRVAADDGAVVVLVRHGEATAGMKLTSNEATVLANVLSATARRVEARR